MVPCCRLYRACRGSLTSFHRVLYGSIRLNQVLWGTCCFKVWGFELARIQELFKGSSNFGFVTEGWWGCIPIGSIVIPVCGSYLGSYKVTPKKELLWSLWVGTKVSGIWM